MHNTLFCIHINVRHRYIIDPWLLVLGEAYRCCPGVVLDCVGSGVASCLLILLITSSRPEKNQTFSTGSMGRLNSPVTCYLLLPTVCPIY